MKMENFKKLKVWGVLEAGLESKGVVLREEDVAHLKEAIEFVLSSSALQELVYGYMTIKDDEGEKREIEQIMTAMFTERLEIYRHGREVMYG